jgi:hypothetical protein
MNAREKTLAVVVGGILTLGVAALGVKFVLLKPLEKIDKQSALLQEKIEKVKAERRAYFAAEDTVKRFAQRTFADQVDQASAKSGEMLTKQILRSGLRESDFSRMPTGPRKLRGASEIGWSVQGQGKLEDVVDLVFLLQESPHLHRVEHLPLSAGDAPGQVRAGFRYLTLVVDPAPVVESIPLQAKFDLESPERKLYDGIVARDLLRPYVKKSPEKSGSNPDRPATPSGPAGLRIVSLTDWMGQPEVHVRDLTSQKTLRFKAGDELAGGTIVMVDYRPLPLPGNEALKSFSRVILKVGTEYWAIERGQTLADKYRLSPERWPEQLSKL